MKDTTSRFNLSRRSLIASLAAAPAVAAIPAPARAQAAAAAQAQAGLKDAKGTKLVLLGTGAGPVPGRTRRMTSHAMLSNGAVYVLDCGFWHHRSLCASRTVIQRLARNFHHASSLRSQRRIRPASVDRLGAGNAAVGPRLRSAAAQANDGRLHPLDAHDDRLLVGRFEDEASRDQD